MRCHIAGSLTAADQKRHIAHEFEVPLGTTRLIVKFDFTPQRSTGQTFANDLSLTVFDPHGARGARHNQRDQNFIITQVYATAGYTPGPLPPGKWTVVIDTHRLLPPDTISYSFDITTFEDPIRGEPIHWAHTPPQPRRAGWYRGDLHGHTRHSDAEWDVVDLAQYARNYRLDFVTLSDHNTVAGLAQHLSLTTDDLVTIGGLELTTYYGHALALGVHHWLDWRVQPGGLTMPQIAANVEAAGGLFIIAHPKTHGDPVCTGCDWTYADMLPGTARYVEIWNGWWNDENEAALRLWYDWLNQGYHMIATAGTDIHEPLYDLSPGFNMVYALEFNEQGILDGVRHGHAYVSAGPRLELTAHSTNGTSAMMGDLLSGSLSELALQWRGCTQGDRISLILDGQPRETWEAEAAGGRTWNTLDRPARWCAMAVRNAQGALCAHTNPIFLSGDWR
jgi:hypothetical protein